MSCNHPDFRADVRVARVEDIGRFVAEISIRCTACDRPFQFLGVDPGFNYDAPTVSIDGLLAHLPICPEGERPNPLQLLSGYSIKGHN